MTDELFELAESKRLLGDMPGAISVYESCDNGDMPLISFRISECYTKLGMYDRTIHACASGLVHDASCVELMWLAGVASLADKKNMQAILWSRMAIAMRPYAVRKIDPVAHNEGPHMTLSDAFRAIGCAGDAETERRAAWAAMSARA